MQKNVNGTITNFLWEKDNLAYELDENFNPIRRYVYDMGKDEVKGHVEFSEAQNNVFDEAGLGWYSYIKDQVGSITQVYSRENYSMAETKTYDVFGNLINKTGNSNCNLGFQGKYFDQESGLYYYYHRYYYPSIGRFINEDPIGLSGGLNMYSFTENDPVNSIDTFGLSHVTPITKQDCNFFITAAKGLYLFLKNYYNMREADTIGADKYFHCLANCMASRLGAGGWFSSVIFSEIREFIDEYIKGDSPAACSADRIANRMGRYGDKTKSCKEICKPLRPCNLKSKY